MDPSPYPLGVAPRKLRPSPFRMELKHTGDSHRDPWHGMLEHLLRATVSSRRSPVTLGLSSLLR